MNKLIVTCFILLSTMNAFSFVVLIDPGHGGKELGAVGKVWEHHHRDKKVVNILEKDLALLLSKKVKHLLEKKHTVYLTRSFDRHVGLNERAQMADTVKADLFVSIHFNSATNSQSHGFETYYLDNHKDAAIKKVEEVENKAFDGEDKVINQILIDLVISKTVTSSKKLAKQVHDNISKYVGKRYKMKDRGIKPGLFYVLALSKRPSILIEGGFLSNSKEAKLIRTKKFLNMYALAIAKGIDQYLSNKVPVNINLF